MNSQPSTPISSILRVGFIIMAVFGLLVLFVGIFKQDSTHLFGGFSIMILFTGISYQPPAAKRTNNEVQ